jgi:hypothetical protein
MKHHVPATILHKLTITVGKKSTMMLPWLLFDNTDTNNAVIHTHTTHKVLAGVII